MNDNYVTVRIGSLIMQLSVDPIYHHGTVRLGQHIFMQPEAAIDLGLLLISAGVELISKEEE